MYFYIYVKWFLIILTGYYKLKMSSFQTIPSVQNNKLLPSFQTYVRKQQKSQVKPEDDDSSSSYSIYGSIK